MRVLPTFLREPRWYQGLDGSAPRSIAYFSPEFGIAAALPQYSGGLGILAGDHLKSASDLGVPLVAVGLFYRSGYFLPTLSTARKASCGISTWPTCFMRRLPSFCFSRSLRLRVTSPP